MRLDHDRLAASDLDFGGRLLGLGLMTEVVHGHIRAMPRQLERDGAADPPAAAGYDCGRVTQHIE
jgi:hypothetical protein